MTQRVQLFPGATVSPTIAAIINLIPPEIHLGNKGGGDLGTLVDRFLPSEVTPEQMLALKENRGGADLEAVSFLKKEDLADYLGTGTTHPVADPNNSGLNDLWDELIVPKTMHNGSKTHHKNGRKDDGLEDGRPTHKGVVYTDRVDGQDSYQHGNLQQLLASSKKHPNKTNYFLDAIGFTGYETTRLFLAYGAEVVRSAIQLYSDGNNLPLGPDSTNIRQGLVATMESIRTRGYYSTEIDVWGGNDIVRRMQDKYKNRGPVMRVRTEITLASLDALTYLIDKYLLGREKPVPAAMSLKVG